VRSLKHDSAGHHRKLLEFAPRYAYVQIFSSKGKAAIRHIAVRALEDMANAPVSRKRYIARSPHRADNLPIFRFFPSPLLNIQRSLLVETHLFARLKVKPCVSCRTLANIGNPTLGQPLHVSDLILCVPTTNSKPYHDHRNQQPEEGECDCNHPKRMHEPRLVEIAKVLIDEPKHPAEEHKCYQFSQCVDHGMRLYHKFAQEWQLVMGVSANQYAFRLILRSYDWGPVPWPHPAAHEDI